MNKSLALMRLKVVLVVILLFFFMKAAQAITLTSTASITEPAGVRYYYTITDWSFTDRTPSRCIGRQQPGGGHPGGVSRCNIEVSLLGSNRGNLIPMDTRWDVGYPETTLSYGQLLTLMVGKGFSMPFEGSALMPVMDAAASQPTCIGLRLSAIDGLFTPCFPLKKATAPPVKCDLAGNTNIDHKILSDTALDGAQASTQLNIKCNGSASVTVKATRTNSYGVSLRGDSLYSEVKINDRDATDGINISATNNLDVPINITSTLKTRGVVAAGPFSGSTVITVSPN